MTDTDRTTERPTGTADVVDPKQSGDGAPSGPVEREQPTHADMDEDGGPFRQQDYHREQETDDNEISGEEIAERMAEEPESTSADQAPERTREGQTQAG